MTPESKRILKAIGLIAFIIACFIIVILTAGCFPTYWHAYGNCQEKAFVQASVANRAGKEVLIVRGIKETKDKKGWHLQSLIEEGWLENDGLHVYTGIKDSFFEPEEYMTFEEYLEHLLARERLKKRILKREAP